MSSSKALLDSTYESIGTCGVCDDHIVTQDLYESVSSQMVGGGAHRQYAGQACFCQGCGIRYNKEVVTRNNSAANSG